MRHASRADTIPPAQLLAELRTQSNVTLAQHYGVAPSTISAWRKRYGLAAPLHVISTLPVQAFREALRHHGDAELSRRYGVHRVTIARWRKRLGLAPCARRAPLSAIQRNLSPHVWLTARALRLRSGCTAGWVYTHLRALVRRGIVERRQGSAGYEYRLRVP